MAVLANWVNRTPLEIRKDRGLAATLGVKPPFFGSRIARGTACAAKTAPLARPLTGDSPKKINLETALGTPRESSSSAAGVSGDGSSRRLAEPRRRWKSGKIADLTLLWASSRLFWIEDRTRHRLRRQNSAPAKAVDGRFTKKVKRLGTAPHRRETALAVQ
jgi:hypothetical protein